MAKPEKNKFDEDILDLPETVSTRLKCGNCGHVARYNVGSVFVDPALGSDMENASEYISFSGYFRCKKCKSSGPWEFTPDTRLMLTALLIGKKMGLEDGRLHIGKLLLSDGSPGRSLAQGEDHLKSLIEHDPDNAVLWRRLGNIYQHAGLIPKARKAYTTATKLNPDDIESQYSLGSIYFDTHKFKLSQEHLHKVIILAYDNRQLSEEDLRVCVSATLDMLFEMSHLTHGEISPFPKLPSSNESTQTEAPIVYMTDFDLSDESDWDRLVDMVIGKRKEADILRNPQKSETFEISRKAACPCGSGKKYKRCCGK